MTGMTFTATGSTLPPLGIYAGTLTAIEDMGTQQSQYGEQHQVKLVLKMHEIISLDDENDDEAAAEYIGTDVWAYANLTFSRRAKLRAWCAAIAGREIEDGEQFAAEEIVGKNVRFTIETNTVGNPTVTDLKRYRKKKTRQSKPQPAEDEFEPDDELDEEEDF